MCVCVCLVPERERSSFGSRSPFFVLSFLLPRTMTTIQTVCSLSLATNRNKSAGIYRRHARDQKGGDKVEADGCNSARNNKICRADERKERKKKVSYINGQE